jgi:hypothetical protein
MKEKKWCVLFSLKELLAIKERQDNEQKAKAKGKKQYGTI